MDHHSLFIFFACLFGLLMTWGVGANDLANVMSTAIGSKAINANQALIIAFVFEFAGAFLAGGNVTATLRNGIIDPQMLAASSHLLIYGMLAVLLAGTTWMFLASSLGLPVSITHTIVGSIVGFGLVVVGVHALNWQQIGAIALSWVTSPIIACAFAFILFMTIQKLILRTDDPLANAKRYVPIYMFLVGFVLSAITVLHGLSHWNIHFPLMQSFLIAMGAGFGLVVLGFVIIRRYLVEIPENPSSRFEQVEKVFSVLMLFTACAMVFAHGSNDVANAVAPMTVIITVVANGGDVTQHAEMPIWVLTLGCSGVVIGFLTYGKRVVETVGTGITALTPSRAFAATLAAATTVVVATSSGIPVSATQTLVGAVLGVGLARGIGALNLVVIRNILMSWMITIPGGCGVDDLLFLFI